jgi:hypothetical protein
MADITITISKSDARQFIAYRRNTWENQVAAGRIRTEIAGALARRNPPAVAPAEPGDGIFGNSRYIVRRPNTPCPACTIVGDHYCPAANHRLGACGCGQPLDDDGTHDGPCIDNDQRSDGR